MSRAGQKHRRQARYERAVRRQIALRKAMPEWYAPVTQFLRPGDDIEMFVDNDVDHSQCDFAWKPVKCDRCGAEYVCTPSSDFYCAAEGDHCCEPRLLAGMRVVTLRWMGGLR